jgi:hypothetical protein
MRGLNKQSSTEMHKTVPAKERASGGQSFAAKHCTGKSDAFPIQVAPHLLCDAPSWNLDGRARDKIFVVISMILLDCGAPVRSIM